VVRTEVLKIMQKMYALNGKDPQEELQQELEENAPPTFLKRVLFAFLNFLARFKRS